MKDKRRIIGVDYGAKRVGVAISDENQTIAVPLSVLPNGRTLFRDFKEIVLSRGVKEVVLGESKDFKGNDNAIMPAVRAFKAELERDLNLKVHLEPEFMTSEQAARSGTAPALLDASAAAIILQSFLDKKKAKAEV